MKKAEYGKEFENIANLFYEFDLEKYEDNQLKQMNTELENRNRELSLELKKIRSELEKIKNGQLFSQKKSYGDIFDEVTRDYGFLTEKSRHSLATAEYLYLNERVNMDYTGVYISYLKIIEIELREKLDLRNKSTLGSVFEAIEKIPELKTFTRAVYNSRILETRNKAVHTTSINKNECGKLRKILIEDNWLDNLKFILEEIAPDKKEIKQVELDLLITNVDGYQRYMNKNHICYETQEGYYLLSQVGLELGYSKIRGHLVEINGIEYIKVEEGMN